MARMVTGIAGLPQQKNRQRGEGVVPMAARQAGIDYPTMGFVRLSANRTKGFMERLRIGRKNLYPNCAFEHHITREGIDVCD
jgi:hypothetical protein